MVGILWFIAAVVLGAVELMAGEFTFLMLAGGALAAAGISLTGLPTWVSVAVFAVTSVGFLVFLRPYLRRKATSPLKLDTSPRALVGEEALVLEPVSTRGGQVKLDGSVWSAAPMDPELTYQPGDKVHVIRIDGTTTIVWKDK